MKFTVTIENVKKASLQLLGATLSDDILSAPIPALIEKDDTYAQYLLSMDESINRALGRIVNANVLPDKTYRLSYSEEYAEGSGVSVSKWYMSVSLENCVKDFYSLVKIDLVKCNGTIISDIDYGVQGDDILLPHLKEGEAYIFTYNYNPLRVSPFMELSDDAKKWAQEDEMYSGEGAYNKNVLDIPDDLANIIPKFVFGELYMHDEPNVAMHQGTNQFEAYLSDYKKPTNIQNNRIQNIFEGFN